MTKGAGDWMVITGRELSKMKEIRIEYEEQDSIRKKFHIVSINGFSVRGVSKFKISNDIVVVCGDNNYNELARIGINQLDHVEINLQFGEYNFILK